MILICSFVYNQPYGASVNDFSQLTQAIGIEPGAVLKRFFISI